MASPLVKNKREKEMDGLYYVWLTARQLFKKPDDVKKVSCFGL